LPRTGNCDLGSILFDNAMFQIETAVKFASSVPTMLKSLSDVVGKISDPKSRESLASMASPPTILNKTISSERSFAGVSISLSRAKAVAKASGGKLNDVVLALSSGVVRRYLISQGGLPNKSLTAAVPISLREEGNADANNQVFGMICSIATNVDDPKTRLETIIAQSTKSKEMSHPLRALDAAGVEPLDARRADRDASSGAALQPLQPLRRAAAGRQHHRLQRAGPRQTLYAAGAELCTSSRCRSRRTASRSTSPCRAIATSSTSASSPEPTSFRMSRCSATCCRKSSMRSRRPMRRRLPKSRARRVGSRVLCR
jgi:hypothetical protein